MIDIKDTFDSFNAEPTTAGTIDADVERGRHARTARNRRRGAGAVLTAAAAAIVVLTQLHPSAGPAGSNVAVSAANTTGSSIEDSVLPGSAHVQLVAYTSAQLPGFVVGEVPEGWTLQGVTNYALLIAPAGDPDTDLHSFLGKLTVMLQSTDVHQLPDGTDVQIGGNPGVIVNTESGVTLTYRNNAGQTVVIQAPKALHWTTQELTRFANGVTVTTHATAGHG